MKLQELRETVQGKIKSLNTNFKDYNKHLPVTTLGIEALKKIDSAQQKLDNNEELSTASVFQIDELVRTMLGMAETAEPPKGLYS